jgi:putative chitinase
MNLALRYRTLLTSYGVNTPLRLAHFFAQIDAESGLKPISENLNYSSQGLRTTFLKYFPTVEIANKYARKPEMIANKVYANRMGNGNEASGDGWKYRGRGFIQITGKDNYRLLSKDTRVDYVNNPDWLLREADSMIAALWYWKSIKANAHADKDNLDAISDLINIGRVTAKIGDANGYEHRKEKLRFYKVFFNL